MVLKNLATGKVICTNLKIAKSFRDRLLGLLIKSNPRFMLFKTRFGIHTFLLKTEIDVLVLDKDLKIVKVKSKIKPNNMFFWNPIYPFVIELPSGTIKKNNLSQSTTLLIC